MAGTPRVIIRGGKIVEEELHSLRYTLDDIYEAMRDSGIFDISQVMFAVVETTGKINFLEVTENAPQINPPAVVIRDGVLDADELARTPLSETRVTELLKQRGLPLESVLVMWVKSATEFEIIKKELTT